MKKKNGFTLIELVVVIALIAILAVTLAPRLRDQIAKAKDSKAIAILGALRTSSEVFFAEKEETVLDFHSESSLVDNASMSYLIGELDTSAQSLFNQGDGVDVTYTAAGLATDLGEAVLFEVPVGGVRTGADQDLSYGGYVRYSFSNSDRSLTTTDGISIVMLGAPATDTHDTKRNDWTSY